MHSQTDMISQATIGPAGHVVHAQLVNALLVKLVELQTTYNR